MSSEIIFTPVIFSLRYFASFFFFLAIFFAGIDNEGFAEEKLTLPGLSASEVPPAQGAASPEPALPGVEQVCAVSLVIKFRLNRRCSRISMQEFPIMVEFLLSSTLL
jgi:hypothetical protein